jgi:flagellar basal-body rod modification protein FlgD
MLIQTAAQAANLTQKPKKAQSELDMSTFLKLLTVQLSNQNPLEPMNDRDFFAQMAQLGQVQGMDKLNKQGEVEQAQNLMGKQVTAVRPGVQDGSREPLVTGIVKKMTVKDGENKISIEEADGGMVEVSVAAIQSINPVKNPADFAYMIGKSVTGKDAVGEVMGKVSVVGTTGGKIMLGIKNSSGKIVNLPLENVSSVGE